MLKPNLLLEGEFAEYESLFKSEFECRKSFRKGETIIGLLDDRSKNCFYVLEGLVSFEVLNSDGRTHVSTMRGKGTVFPLYYTYRSTSVERTLEVKALRDTELIVVPKAGLRALMTEKPEVAFSMMDAYGKYLTYVNYEVEAQLFNSVKTRLANFLYLHCDAHGEVRATHASIAETIGASRANVTRAMGSMRRAGILESHRGKIQIISKRRLLDCCSYFAAVDDAE